MKKISIGNSSGFWGDDPHALLRQATGGPIDYIVSDYLAEVSMSILQKQQARDPDKGYVQDFVEHLLMASEPIHQKGICVITNAGGNNPLKCAEEVIRRLQEEGRPMKVAVVDGDNIIGQISALREQGAAFSNMETGQSFDTIAERLVSANAYIGFPPILAALKTDAQIIITGRVTDSALAMAPMIHELGWASDDWNKLGAGMIAAHIIECGAQSTGGNFTDWMKVPRWDNIGFPIVTMFENGEFTVSKHDNTGGLVSVNTVKEQLVYEIGDPKHYYGPDVIADLTELKLNQERPDVVAVKGGKGKPPTDQVKISMAYQQGYRAKGDIIISAPNAYEKAAVYQDIFWGKFTFNFQKKNTEFIGHNACHLDLATSIEANDILLRFYVADPDQQKINEFSKQIAALILSGPPGVAVTGGRPRPQGNILYWPALINKSFLKSQVYTLNDHGEVMHSEEIDLKTSDVTTIIPEGKNIERADLPAEYGGETSWMKCKLKDLCLARSGDKGNAVNIGLIARSEEVYAFIKAKLTAGVLKGWFSSLAHGAVTRYEIPNLLAFNYVLEEALDGGGTQAMRIDAQGKTFASALLNIEITVPPKLLKDMNP